MSETTGTTDTTMAAVSAEALAEFSAFMQKIVVPAEFRRDFYVFAALFTEWLARHEIGYFLHSGTALGQVRHRGFIPWDDDIDVMVEECHEARLLAAMPGLADYGIRLNPKHSSDGHYQFSLRNPIVPTSMRRFYCFDIFIGQRVQVDGRTVLHYKHPDFRKWFADRHCPVDDVYPLERGDFGPLRLWCMRDPSDYFRRANFRTDEATLSIHLVDPKWLEERIAYFRKVGLYPIRDPEILARQDITEIDYLGLDAYKLR